VKLVVSREAAADFERLHNFLREENTNAAQRLVAVLSDAVESLSLFPDRGRLSGIPAVRELIVPFGRSSYIIRYTHLADDDAVVVLRMWHGRELR
jgi:plasmid stabilization system protein ParE